MKTITARNGKNGALCSEREETVEIERASTRPTEFVRYLNMHPFANRLRQKQLNSTFFLKTTFTIIACFGLIFFILGPVS